MLQHINQGPRWVSLEKNIKEKISWHCHCKEQPAKFTVLIPRCAACAHWFCGVLHSTPPWSMSSNFAFDEDVQSKYEVGLFAYHGPRLNLFMKKEVKSSWSSQGIIGFHPLNMFLFVCGPACRGCASAGCRMVGVTRPAPRQPCLVQPAVTVMIGQEPADVL